MHWKPGPGPRRHSVRGFALRLAAATAVCGLLGTVLVSLVRSDGMYRVVDPPSSLRRGAFAVTILPDVEERAVPKTSGGSSGDGIRPRAQTDTVPHHNFIKWKKRSIYDTDSFKNQLKTQAEESLGRVSRLQSSLDEPLGSLMGGAPLCHPFDADTATVAIVGNGPLSAEDRSSIDACDIVVRFNLMNNWRRFQEKIDVWIMRFSTEAKAGYWGINNINKEESHKILSQLKGTWLVGGTQAQADKLLSNHPVMEQHYPVLMPEAPMNKVFAADLLESPSSYPSTGFVGIQAVLHCTPSAVQLHVYGFNWSNKTWGGHNVLAEQEFVAGLEAAGRAVVHPTACSGMRECGKGDVDASCHWSTDGHYLCLRGKPKKWVDMTKWVSKDRVPDFSGRAPGSR